MVYYWQCWRSIPSFPTISADLKLSVSVVIPARNEEENIIALLNALKQQSYPASHIEIIVVDDHSADRTAELTERFGGVRLIRLNDDGINSYKKKAIATGIEASAGELIITTDADCVPPPGWIQTIVHFKQQTGAVLIVAPVVFDSNTSLLESFQSLDFMMMQGITGAAVHHRHLSMCNGANLCYEKKAYYEVDGFRGIDQIASGDDMLLMHKIADRYPGRTGYLKSAAAIVRTSPMKTWKTFFHQRIRWASKAAKYDDKRIFWVLLLVYLFNFSFILLFIAGLWDIDNWKWLAVFWIVKTLAELPLFFDLGDFFKKPVSVLQIFLFQPLHIIYVSLSGLLSQFGKYEWKGRMVR